MRKAEENKKRIIMEKNCGCHNSLYKRNKGASPTGSENALTYLYSVCGISLPLVESSAKLKRDKNPR